eukprot:TRINITY_DN14587_c0_g1_i1.p1 TRINITY_DN14587_c0_g1~~TRINITY_DN14587_c0_g1_i1.p1  ORF type:complete len:473 (+),score=150.93 TRINITY_DN14587_c0_g1_i1:26-1420(+)
MSEYNPDIHLSLPIYNEKRWAKLKQWLSMEITNADQLQMLFGLITNKRDEILALKTAAASFDNFFTEIFPFIQGMALKLPELFESPVKLLLAGNQDDLVLTAEQICCLVSHQFLCTLTRDQNSSLNWGNFPSIDFEHLHWDSFLVHQREKIKCFIQYFESCRTESEFRDRKLRIRRCVLDENDKFDWWNSGNLATVWSEKGLGGEGEGEGEGMEELEKLEMCHEEVNGSRMMGKARIEAKIGIEKMDGMLQMDFANAYIGGGVLEQGNVQEELMFTVSSEMIVSMLVCEKMMDNESIILDGFPQFSEFSGYGGRFEFEGPSDVDLKDLDEEGMFKRSVIAVDALMFWGGVDQFDSELMERELNKLYSGFKHCPLKEVAAGRWGCGMFGGYAPLKALLIYIAASACQKDIVFCSFGNSETDALEDISAVCEKKDVDVTDVLQLIAKAKDEQMFLEKIVELLQKGG